MKKSRSIIIGLIILVIVLLAVVFTFTINNDTKDIKIKKETYNVYVKINPSVKITFDMNFECSKKDDCNVKKNIVTNIDFLNDDAKIIYAGLSYKDKSLEEVVASLIDIADENDKNISNVLLTSTYEFDKEEIIKAILSSLKTSKNVEINYNYQKEIDENNMTEATTISTTTKTTTTKTSKCVSKKFKKKFTYVYNTKDECKKEGNNAFNNITDTVDDSIFSYGCEEIKDDCGDTWYGVVFYKWSEEKGEYPYYY